MGVEQLKENYWSRDFGKKKQEEQTADQKEKVLARVNKKGWAEVLGLTILNEGTLERLDDKIKKAEILMFSEAPITDEEYECYWWGVKAVYKDRRESVITYSTRVPKMVGELYENADPQNLLMWQLDTMDKISEEIVAKLKENKKRREVV